jgi:PAT family beta-lactamase induction signal transducer AmpG
MVTMLAPVAPGGKLPSVADFTKTQGPWIVAATVLFR